ncbi:MAG TPA: hypothetical protein VD998_00510, partial [Verrucomicrobiae bacterium]|nr:hypothetical protein [Verrucomicrobiae bacterium]
MTNIFASYSKIIAGTLVAVLIASNILFIGTVLLIPKKAEATWPTITMVNIADELKEIARGLVITFATRFVNQFLTRFINRLVEKYKIRNYLYYDQILSNYYLTNYIRDKVQDPDLQRIYDLLNSAYITGQNTGLPGQPAPNNAVIPQLRQAIYDHYIQVGGVPNDFLNQPQNYSAANYYRSAQSYYLNHPSYTERHLSGQFGGFQANSTTAAQLEVIVGNGLKAGRALGGTCELSGEATSGSNPNGSPQACAAAGGTWRASSFDQARSFIDNPAGFIDKHLGSAISTMFNVNYDPSKNSFYFQIGSLLGSFLFNRLFLDSPA